MAGTAPAVAMALTAPAVEAAFLYVPPEGPAQQPEVRAPASEGGQGEADGPEAPGAVRTGGTANESPLYRTAVAGEEDAPATVEAGIEDPDPGLWRVHSEETLRAVLSRWGGRAGVEVLFLTDRRYRLHETWRFRGSFAEANEALLGALSHLPHPPVGELGADGRRLAVLHRARQAGDEQ